MSYEVIKTIGGRRYRYLQETYREGGKVRTRNVYLGPVDGERRGGVTELLQDMVCRRDRRETRGETEAQMCERVATEDKAYAAQDRINDMLTAPSISMDALGEIAAAHSEESEADQSEGEAGEASP